jgi:hypothetical protein
METVSPKSAQSSTLPDGPSTPNLRREPNDRTLLLGFLAFNAIFRLALIHQNAGEYTDGILQITQFERTDSFWPPLYTALVWAVRMMGVEAILAGRLVACAAATLLVLPLWSLAREWSGRRAALFTAALYTVSPLALRWSLHVMTDMPFVLFFHLACVGLLRTVGRLKAVDHMDEVDPMDQAPHAASQLVRATLWAVLATLTRYQGLMLAPLLLVLLLMLWRQRCAGRMAATAAQMAWLALPAWLLYERFGHVAQVIERQGGSWAETLLNYWNLFEMFVYIVPYAVTLPVFVFCVIGLVQGPLCRSTPSRSSTSSDTDDSARDTPYPRLPVRWLLLYIALAVLTAQSIFQSFLTRYLLPLLPLLLTCAGAGMARMERFFGTKGRESGRQDACPTRARWLLFPIVAATIFWPLAFGLASVMLQRGAFGDLYEAGRMIRDKMQLPPSAKVYSNETYKPKMNAIKIAFASGHKAEMIPDVEALNSKAILSLGLSQREILERWDTVADAAGVPRMEPGSVVALHSAYGGPSGLSFIEALLAKRYHLKPVRGGVFESSIVPLLPDIMQEGGTHQNPLAWALRYQTQRFQTRLYLVP